MNNIIKLYLVLFISLAQFSLLMAGPGGTIAKSLTDTKIGKFIVLILIVVLFPFVVFGFIKDKILYRKTMADLVKLGMKDGRFRWLTLKTRITDVYTRVHRAWDKKYMADVSDFMTDWYWQNQQFVHLDKWAQDGLENICQRNQRNQASLSRN